MGTKGHRYRADIWWTGTDRRIYTLTFSFVGLRDGLAAKTAKGAFERTINQATIRKTESVQIRVVNEDGRVVSSVSTFL